jgi:hypothetical protein
MPFDQVMKKFKEGKLKMGSKHGKPVKDKKQALAIMLSEKSKAKEGKSEYKGKKLTSPSANFMKRFSAAK